LTDTIVEPGPGPLPAAAITAPPNPAEEFARQLALAGEYEAQGRLDEAEILLNRLLAENADRPRALHLLGIVSFRKGRTTDALKLVERAIALMPDASLFHRNLCEMSRKLHRYDAALLAGLRAIELDPTDPHARHTSASCITTDSSLTTQSPAPRPRSRSIPICQVGISVSPRPAC
jgi:tetratricopeptide (TPR) repeat protein